MGIIGGIYHLNKKNVDKVEKDSIIKSIESFSFDSKGEWSDRNIFMTCYSKFITPESVNEKLPLIVEEAEVVIAADAIIDNREELMDLLAIPLNMRKNIVDSYLIFLSYEKWGEDCPKYLVGDFAFSIWDGRKQMLLCARDAMGKRTLYYANKNKTFVFSTLIKPLLDLPYVNDTLNDTWIADFLSITSVLHELDPELTVYKDIKQLPPAHMMIITPLGVQIKRYWELPKKELVLKSDAEYEEIFLEVFTEAVRCRMRSVRPVGVLMSGGLDSGSVACVAANELKKSGQVLQCFSHVPLEGNRDWLPKNKIADETPYIEAIRKYSGNMDVHYCRCEHKNSYNIIDKLLDIFEQPYKIVENSYWMDAIMEEAQKRNIGVLLDGQSGNGTISWGEYIPYFLTLLERGSFLKFFHEGKIYADKKKQSLFRLMLGLIRNYLPYDLLRKRYLSSGKEDYRNTLSPINPEFARKMKVEERHRMFGEDPLFLRRKNSFLTRKYLNDIKSVSHLGALETKHSLAYGVERRDPTRDRRLVELCMSIPEEQYVRNGVNRRLIRHSMKGILPDQVRLNETVRGQQGVDWSERLVPFQDDIKKELSTLIECRCASEYIDVAKIKKMINILDDNLLLSTALKSETRMLMRVLIFLKFVCSKV